MRRCARGSIPWIASTGRSGPPGLPTRAGPGPPGRAICASCWEATSSCSSTEHRPRRGRPMFIRPRPTRRQFVGSLMGGSLLLPGIVSELLADGPAPSRDADPLAPRAPHFPGKAKRVIFLFMTGGVSHLESFDPKPRLVADGGKQYKGKTLLPPQFKFSPAGAC